MTPLADVHSPVMSVVGRAADIRLRRPLDPVGALTSPLGAAIGAAAAAGLVGMAMAVDIRAGMALLVAIVVAPVVILDLPAGVAIWIFLTFLQGITALNAAGKAVGLLLAIVWIGNLRSRDRPLPSVFTGSHRRILDVLILLLAWLTLSAAWAHSADAVASDIWHWYAVALIFGVVATSATTPRAFRVVLIGFVAGAIVSVLLGLAQGGLGGGATATSGDPSGARLAGGAGDPNFLAAGIVSAIALTGGMLVLIRSRAWRRVGGALMPLLLLGLVATESRGGIVAAAGALVAALLFLRGRRLWVLGLIVTMAATATLWFAASPSALQRLSSVGTGSGRTDLWTIGWRVFETRPMFGAGLNNFQLVAPSYIRRPGLIKEPWLILNDGGHFVHNAYLHMLADVGIPGFIFFMGLVGLCLYASFAAAKSFQRADRRDLETLARCVLVAQLGMMVASFFISDQVDQRLWTLLALGPALLGVATTVGANADVPLSAGRSRARRARRARSSVRIGVDRPRSRPRPAGR